MPRLLAALLFACALLVGCTPSAQTLGGVQRPKTYATVVSLSPSTSELVGSLFLQTRLVGRTAACDWPEATKQAPVMGGVKPDFEAIAAAKPDAILYDASLYSPADIERLKQLNIDLIEMKVSTLDEYMTWLSETASILGGETEASEFNDKVYNARRAALAEAATGPKRRVMMILGGNGGEYMVAGLGTFQADLLRACGFEPVGPADSKFVSINVEQILKDNPDAIVVAGDPARLLADARLKTLPALAGKKVVAITDQNMVLRAGGRIDAAISNLRPSVEGLFR